MDDDNCNFDDLEYFHCHDLNGNVNHVIDFVLSLCRVILYYPVNVPIRHMDVQFHEFVFVKDPRAFQDSYDLNEV